ncbi:glycosyltransferase family 4 protein, partial [Dehalococcoidia bacterium]|nr:glycosyltransferase family 4 protein [Dehalococcoidia bacterium]
KSQKIKVLMQGFSGEIGLTYHLARLAVGLSQQGIDVVLITTDKEQVKGLKKELEEKNIKYYESNFIDKKFWNLPAVYKSMREIKSIINSENIDIIHTHGAILPIYLAARLPLFGRKVPVVETENSWASNIIDITKPKKLLMKMATKLINLCVDIIMPVSEQFRQELIIDGFKPEKLRVIHWGIDLEKFDNDKSSPKFLSKYQQLLGNIQGKVVVQSGMLYPWKGTEFLLKAAPTILQGFPDTKFLIVGGGPLRSQLEELANTLGISQSVIFTGGVGGDFVPVILSHADIGVVPSLHETFSIAFIEMMAASKPVVITPVGVAPEIVTPENDIGYIVPLKDPEALADAIIKLLADPGKAREMGSRGRRLVEEKFTMNVMTKRLKEVYEMAIESKSQNRRRIS